MVENVWFVGNETRHPDKSATPCVYADNGRGITEHKSERGAVREWDVALLR